MLGNGERGSWRRDAPKYSCGMLPLPWDHIPAPQPAPAAPSGMREKTPTNPFGQLLLLPGVSSFPQHQNQHQKLFLPPAKCITPLMEGQSKADFCGQRAGEPQPAEPESHSAGFWETLSVLSMEKTQASRKIAFSHHQSPIPAAITHRKGSTRDVAPLTSHRGGNVHFLI